MKPSSELLEKSRFPMKVYSADGGIRTLVPRRANAFRVRPVMTASIRLQIMVVVQIVGKILAAANINIILLQILKVKELSLLFG